jgi:hypothetical protein
MSGFIEFTQAYMAAARLPWRARARFWCLRHVAFPVGRVLYCRGFESAAVTLVQRAAQMGNQKGSVSRK